MGSKYVCKTCGSSDILVQMWVDPNTLEIDSWVADGDEQCYCYNCEATRDWISEEYLKEESDES